MEKETINWQFVDKYYDYLNKKIQATDYHLREENDFTKALEELETIFIHINGEILKNDDTKKYYSFIKAYIVEIRLEINIYKTLEMPMKKYSKKKLMEMSKLKEEITTDIKTLYELIMRIISDLNMFFPKVKKDTRTGMQRFEEKYI